METSFESIQERPRGRGPLYGALLSVVAHVLLVTYVVRREPALLLAEEPPVRYVEFLPNAAEERMFTEAPGPESEKTAPEAAFSNRNRIASTPNPTGEQSTKRPGAGDGGPEFRAPGSERGRAQERAQNGERGTENAERGTGNAERGTDQANPEFVYREQVDGGDRVDWSSAIREVGKLASLGSDAGALGGETGFAESGPISFETQWYEWGDYADGMVRKIRVNWYGNMPALIRTGMKGVVTIRFTIQRSGQVTDVTILKSSGVPPYDYAARKAIELSSPLAALPKDFPNASERVTAMFYYNLNPRE